MQHNFGIKPASQHELCPHFAKRIYFFKGERLPSARSRIGRQKLLSQDASNLAEVLNVLQSNRRDFQNYCNFVSYILPSIKDIRVELIENDNVEIRVSSVDPELDRPDLYMNLSECGSGVGQALAIAYILTSQKSPSIIIIDEPNGFLHPSAARRLVESMRERSIHQCIISTHSPEVIAAAKPESILLVKWSNNQSIVEEMDAKALSNMRQTLKEVGVRISDVFGLSVFAGWKDQLRRSAFR
jgi:predicted ATPase